MGRRYRAERRLGQMMEEQPKAPNASQLPKRGNQHTGVEVVDLGFSDNPKPMSLAAAGIDKNLAHRARKLAA